MPGWQFRFFGPDEFAPGVHALIYLTGMVPDVRDPENEVQVYRHTDVSSLLDSDLDGPAMEKAAVFFMRDLIWAAMEHEIDEWFKVGGARVGEPVHG